MHLFISFYIILESRLYFSIWARRWRKCLQYEMLTTWILHWSSLNQMLLLHERKNSIAPFVVYCRGKNFIPTQTLAHTTSSVHRSTSLIWIDILRYSHCKFPFPSNKNEPKEIGRSYQHFRFLLHVFLLPCLYKSFYRKRENEPAQKCFEAIVCYGFAFSSLNDAMYALILPISLYLFKFWTLLKD